VASQLTGGIPEATHEVTTSESGNMTNLSSNSLMQTPAFSIWSSLGVTLVMKHPPSRSVVPGFLFDHSPPPK